MSYYYFQHYTLRIWKTDLSSMLMRKYLEAPYIFLLSYNSATILRNVNNIISTSLNGFILNAFNFLANCLTGFIILSLIYLKYFTTSLIIASILITSTVLQSFFLKKKLQQIGEEKNDLLESQNKNVYQGVHSIKETKVMNKESFFMKAFDLLNYRVIKNDSKSMLISRLPSHINEIVVIISVLIICSVVLLDSQGNTVNSIANLGVLAAIAFRISPIMNRTLNNLQGMNKSSSSIKTFFKEVNKFDQFETDSNTGFEDLTFESNLVLRNLSFKYPKSKKFALNNLNVEIKKGQFIGIVGPSGAGKTTLGDLLLGLLEPTSGELIVDDCILGKSNIKTWQDKLSFVPQQVYFFDDTLLNNIAFGLSSESVSSERVEEVIKDSMLYDLISAKAEGSDFVIGENGRYLSGGQKQRLAIARALYKDSEILILDEATSALDVITEDSISKTLQKQRGKKTVIAIAHRLSTIYEADKILFMDEGIIQDQGTFAELVSRNSEFQRLAKIGKII